MSNAEYLEELFGLKGRVAVVIGGAAIDGRSSAGLGADGWASDARSAVEAVTALTS